MGKEGGGAMKRRELFTYRRALRPNRRWSGNQRNCRAARPRVRSPQQGRRAAVFARRQCNSRVHNDEQRPNDDRFALYMLSSKLYGECSLLRVRYRLKWRSIPQFLTRDAMLARYMLSSCVRLSVRPSVTGSGIEQRYSSASDREKKNKKNSVQ